MKKLLSLVLCAALLLAVTPTTPLSVRAAAVDSLTYTVTDGAVTITGCDTAFAGELVIPKTIDDYPVTAIGTTAFKSCKSLTGVTIPDGVTTIGQWAFYSCTALKSVTLSESVTTIVDGAFENCRAITDVYYDGSNQTAITIGASNTYLLNAAWHYAQEDVVDPLTYEFDDDTLTATVIGCDESATDVEIPSTVVNDGKTYTVTSIGDYAFDECWILTSVTIPGSVTSIGESAFLLCVGLISVTIENGVTSIGPYAFGFCEKLTEIVIPDSVTVLDYAVFSCCTALTSVTMGSGVASVEDRTFEGCSALTEVNVSKSNTTYCSEDGVLFDKSKTRLVYYPIGKTEPSYTIPDGVVYIDRLVFSDCTNLVNITMPDSVAIIDTYVFHGCTALTDIIVSANNAAYCSQDGVLFNKDKTMLVCYPAGRTETSYTVPETVTDLGYRSFSNCTNLVELILPDGMVSIPNETFGWCALLTSVTIPASVTYIGCAAFFDCNNLTDVYYGGSEQDRAAMMIEEDYNDTLLNATWHYAEEDVVDPLTYEFDDDTLTATVIGCDESATDVEIPATVTQNGKTYTVTAIGEFAFYEYSSLTSVAIPNSVTIIGDSAFYGCSSLTSVDIPDSVITIDISAFGCSGLTSIIIPDSVTLIGDGAFDSCYDLTDVIIGSGVTTIDAYAFFYCTSLTSITIPDNVTFIGEAAFADCDNLITAQLGQGLTVISNSTFCGCDTLQSVTLSENVTAIEDSAFDTCPNLTSITLPQSLIDICYGSFAGCDSLTDVYYSGSKQDRENIQIDEMNDALVNAEWHYAIASCSHQYDDEYDADCNLCGETREVPDRPETPLFVVDNTTATVGKTVTVTVRTEKNSGIVSFKLDIGYDAALLELLSIEGGDFDGAVFGPTTNNPIAVSWVDAITPNNETNGVVATLTFLVKDDAPECTTPITLAYDADDVYDYDFENVTFDTVDGTVTIIDYISGDVNDDGLVNNKDIGILQRYLNGWTVDINLYAANVNEDDSINNKDIGILQRHLNGWDTILNSTTTAPTATTVGSVTTTTATRTNSSAVPAVTTTTYNGQTAGTLTAATTSLTKTTTTNTSWSPFV